MLIIVAINATFASALIIVVVSFSVSNSFNSAPVVGSGVFLLSIYFSILAASTVPGALVINVVFFLLLMLLIVLMVMVS